MQKTVSFLTLFSLLVLAGCADSSGITPSATILQAGTMPIEQSAAAPVSDAAWPDVAWWTGYQDPQLDVLIREGLAHSPTMTLAAARLRQAEGLAGVSKSALSPQVSGSASLSEQHYSKSGPYPSTIAGNYRTNGRFRLDGSYDLDLWGGNRAAFEAALGTVRASEIDAQAARLTLATTIASTYVQLATAYDDLDINRDLLRQKQDISGLSGDLVSAGLLTEVESRQARAAIAVAKAQIARSDEQITLLKQDLAILVGRGPDWGLSITRPSLHQQKDLVLPTVLPADLIGRRPDIVAQRWRIEAATHEIDAAKAQFYPDINLSALVGMQSIGLEHLFSASSYTLGAGPALTLPIFDGGRLRANLTRVTADLDADVAQYNSLVLGALREIVGQLTSWRDTKVVVAQERDAVSDLQEAYRLALLRYREGLNNYLTVLSAEGDLIAQRRQEVQARNRQYQISIALIHALGGGVLPQSSPVRNSARTTPQS